ncbi:8-oxoguanine DNA glycosylase OGG fold protein [Actinosynnema sp. NPDC004786]
MTDLTTVALPPWAVPSRPREVGVGDHAIRIRERWWRSAIGDRGLPGRPPVGPTLTRAEVWAPADDVFTTLWRVLAWGSGSRLRQNARRLDSIAADVPRAERLLTEAAARSRHDPAGAYAVLWPDGRSAIGWLGPSFFTKFLYFAGGGSREHPCLILDRVVATALRDHCGWASLDPAGSWPARTYQRYCDLLARWAREHRCAPDEVELALFAGPPDAG